MLFGVQWNNSKQGKLYENKQVQYLTLVVMKQFSYYLILVNYNCVLFPLMWVHSLLPLQVLTLALADFIPHISWSLTKRVENLQHRDGNELRGRKEHEDENIQCFNTFYCLPFKPDTTVLTRQTEQLAFNWRLKLLFLSR